jgi:hypothetical protein
VDEPAGSQEIFDRYLAARMPCEDPESLLDILLSRHAWPLLQRVVGARLGNLYRAADAEELTAEATLQLLGRLRKLREDGPPPDGIRIDAYIAGIGANTVLRFLSRRYPESTRLRKRLRYLCETDRRFRIWAGEDGCSLCALSGGPSFAQPATPAAIERCRQRMGEAAAGQPLEVLLARILTELKGSIELSPLVALVAELQGIREHVLVSRDQSDDPAGLVPDPAPPADRRLELRQRLECLWSEVRLLPPGQRSALLLNLGSSHGAAVWLLNDLGIATFRELAEVLEISREDLAALWNRLPLEDLAIAERLAVTRQQVINLRAAARQRLQRRETQRAKAAVPISGSIRR